MQESPLDTVVPERDFAEQLAAQASAMTGVAHSLLAAREAPWRKRDFFRLDSEADDLEGYLDDVGARYNQTFCLFTELTASIRGFSLAGLSLAHLSKRLEGYGVLEGLEGEDREAARAGVLGSVQFIQDSLVVLLRAWFDEARGLGVALPEPDSASQAVAVDPTLRLRLPRTVGQEDIQDESQRIAEVATKYIAACELLKGAGLRRANDASARAALLAERCTEELARVFEATVHNLQSAYDTHIGNTRLEAADPRLRSLRGYISTALHLFEAVTQLTHFVERHQSGTRSEFAQSRLEALLPREAVQRVVLEDLLHWAQRFLHLGRSTAEELLPSYSDLQEIVVELNDGITFHARPASLVVAIVNHHGTPVEMEVDGRSCNAGSILELMVTVGSYPEQRAYTLRGDKRPLADLVLLFENDLGEHGIANLPEQLAYLRTS